MTPGTHLRNATGEMTTEGKGGTYPRPYAYEVSRGVGGGRCGLHFYIWPRGEAELSPTGRFFSCSVYPVLNSLLPHTGNLPLSRGCCPLWQPADRGPRRQASGQSRARASQAAASGSPTHLGLLLMQLYLDVCELGPEVFVGSLKGDNERLGLLALISPFLGHCSSLNGVCWCLIPLKQGLPCYCCFSRVRWLSSYCVLPLGKVSSAAVLEALGEAETAVTAVTKTWATCPSGTQPEPPARASSRGLLSTWYINLGPAF